MKTNYKLLFAAGSVILSLTACSKTDVKSVDWYVEHKTERDAVMKECGNDAVTAKTDRNCLNAKEATYRLYNSKDVKNIL